MGLHGDGKGIGIKWHSRYPGAAFRTEHINNLRLQCMLVSRVLKICITISDLLSKCVKNCDKVDVEQQIALCRSIGRP